MFVFVFIATIITALWQQWRYFVASVASTSLTPNVNQTSKSGACNCAACSSLRPVNHGERSFKHRAPREEDRSFRALFGCGTNIVLNVWNRLEEKDLVPHGGTLTHLLWTFMHCKQYCKWKTFRRMTEADPKTIRKWINLFFCAIELIEGDVVRTSVIVLGIAAHLLIVSIRT